MLVTSISVEIEVKKHDFEKSNFLKNLHMGLINCTGGCSQLQGCQPILGLPACLHAMKPLEGPDNCRSMLAPI